jgi:hypothetical protein
MALATALPVHHLAGGLARAVFLSRPLLEVREPSTLLQIFREGGGHRGPHQTGVKTEDLDPRAVQLGVQLIHEPEQAGLARRVGRAPRATSITQVAVDQHHPAMTSSDHAG